MIARQTLISAFTAALAMTVATMCFGGSSAQNTDATITQDMLIDRPEDCSQLERHVGVSAKFCGYYTVDQLGVMKAMLDKD